MSNLAIVLLTYARTEYAIRALCSTLHGIRWSGSLGVHIADDGSLPEHRDSLLRAISDCRIDAISLSDAARGGYGKNYNLALQQVHQWADYVLPLEDDWELLRPLDCDLLARVVDELGQGCIRLGYIGYTRRLQGWFEYYQNVNWLRLDPRSEEPHVFAGHPRFESVSWEKRLGPWPEGLSPGATEFEVAHRPDSRRDVLWPVEIVKPSGDLFVHIGAVRSTDV